MSPAKFQIQEHKVLEIVSEMFKRILSLTFMKDEFDRQHMSLYFTVCEFLET